MSYGDLSSDQGKQTLLHDHLLGDRWVKPLMDAQKLTASKMKCPPEGSSLPLVNCHLKGAFRCCHCTVIPVHSSSLLLLLHTRASTRRLLAAVTFRLSLGLWFLSLPLWDCICQWPLEQAESSLSASESPGEVEPPDFRPNPRPLE